jgi:hypothetical protein
MPDRGAFRLASKLVHPAHSVTEPNTGRRCDEMHRPARVAHDAHVDRHGEDYGTVIRQLDEKKADDGWNVFSDSITKMVTATSAHYSVHILFRTQHCVDLTLHVFCIELCTCLRMW